MNQEDEDVVLLKKRIEKATLDELYVLFAAAQLHHDGVTLKLIIQEFQKRSRP